MILIRWRNMYTISDFVEKAGIEKSFVLAHSFVDQSIFNFFHDLAIFDPKIYHISRVEVMDKFREELKSVDKAIIFHFEEMIAYHHYQQNMEGLKKFVESMKHKNVVFSYQPRGFYGKLATSSEQMIIEYLGTFEPIAFNIEEKDKFNQALDLVAPENIEWRDRLYPEDGMAL